MDSGQTKDYNTGIFCFSDKHAALRRKSKDWLALNQNNVPRVWVPWSDMSTHRLLFQWASTIKFQLNLITISLKINLFSPWYSWKIAELVLNKNHSLTHKKTHHFPGLVQANRNNRFCNSSKGEFILKKKTRYDYNLTIMEVSQTGHWHYLPTYQILMISDNVEFLPPIFMPCFGNHFENGRYLENFENAELLL
jgi:hypothetical protein